jgi:two-component system, LuxR family, sensor histidine kinase DctS
MHPAPTPPVRAPRRLRRVLLWSLLIALLVVAQSALLVLTLAYESSRAQEQAESVAGNAALAVRREVLGLAQGLQALSWLGPGSADRQQQAELLLRQRPTLRHLEWRDESLHVAGRADSPYARPLFAMLPRRELGAEAEQACRLARRAEAPMASRTYYVPVDNGLGTEVAELCVPLRQEGRPAGFVVGTLSLTTLLEGLLTTPEWQRYELSFVEGDGARLARAGSARGAGVFVAEHAVDLPGQTLLLRANSAAGKPGLIPNLAIALVLGLSLALFAVVMLLVRDVRRRAEAEAALAEAFGFRKAMEDSLSTGLRARDMAGAVTYANPAFCQMVGFTLDELRSAAAHPPYWPPEHAAEYAERQRTRLAGGGRAPGEAREGYESVFLRKDGERFPVMIYEAPLRDRSGAQTGWMSAVLDLSAQRRIEDLSRQQHERLQASARLATVGEMASLLGHELNQPLAAIASYAAGSLNVLDDADPAATPASTHSLLRPALTRIAEQAERAGRVIKSVHDFVRRREQPRESLAADRLLEGVLPLVRMQARKSSARVEIELPPAPERVPRVSCDRTLVEQVLLNLARNGIQAMEGGAAQADGAERVLRIRVHAAAAGRVLFEVADRGPGIAPDVAARLFTPFFTTRAEGMGLGLSLCRTVVEQHGGTLEFAAGADGLGTVFRFSLPAAREREPEPDLAAAPADNARESTLP